MCGRVLSVSTYSHQFIKNINHHKDFVLNAIRNLRKPGYNGIHVVYSGFNKAFRDYYEEEPMADVEKLVADNVIVKTPVKGGCDAL